MNSIIGVLRFLHFRKKVPKGSVSLLLHLILVLIILLVFLLEWVHD
jgi:hypothetical protein